MRIHPECPKHMVFGPCGGVRGPGTCEVDDRSCPFVGAPLVRWPGDPVAAGVAPARARGLLAGLARGDGVIADLRVRPLDVASVDSVARVLGPACDALLVGDHQSRPDLPPSLMAQLVRDAGADPWITLTCRDRNRVVLESEVAALAALGVEGVHCVTGDARAPSVRTDATQVFDLDSLRLAALARTAGLAVSVAATPVAPPRDLRPKRLVEKERAGAQVCFVNHAGGAAAVADFVAAARAAGARIPFVACVAVFTDAASAAVLAGFPGLELEQGEVAQVLGSSDPVRAGIAAAVAQARAMFAIEGVCGVNLSGAATGGSEEDSAEIMATVAREIRSA
ncbi:MAG: methylenetetrahydrofolate reductase C-terminal domain-containing protein [Acidimicrobiales bacterium]